MSDIATVIVKDQTTGRTSFDWAMDGPDLLTDEGLQTSVYNSLFTDRQAAPDDKLPTGDNDRRGWWGDMRVDGSNRKPKPSEMIGSRLWLLSGCKQTKQTATLAKHYALEALRWLTLQGIAQSVDVQTVWVRTGTLGILITIAQKDGKKQAPAVATQFAYLWSDTMVHGMDPPQFPALVQTLTTESGSPITTEGGETIVLG